MQYEDPSGLPLQALSCQGDAPPFSPAALARLQQAQTFARSASRQIFETKRRRATDFKKVMVLPARLEVGSVQPLEREMNVPLEQRLCALFAD